jgi:DNA-directed RNA polymerase specialized sigma24 family protein
MKPTFINDKCTAGDYRKLFASSTEELRWLCYTLTGDPELADKALDAAMEQSLKGAGHVFREWMMSWTRRLLIKYCITVVRPSQSALARSAYPLFPMRFEMVRAAQVVEVLEQPSEMLQQKLWKLDELSRFVFVLRGLEGYSRHDAALLLDIDDRACEWLYVWAVRTLGSDKHQQKQRELRPVLQYA